MRIEGAEVGAEPTAPVIRAASSDSEEVWYYRRRDDWYKGPQPCFPDVADDPETKLLEDNYEVIREEIEERYGQDPEALAPNFTPYGYEEEGWRTLNLYTYFFRYPKNCAVFPHIDALLREIPGMCMAQIAVLKPNTRIKAHVGDTNVVLRRHLGIRVPGTLPELGIQVGRERRCWEEGKVFALSIARRHYAWNYTDSPRIALVVDTIREEYRDRQYEVAGNTLGLIAMKALATRFPVLKRLPPSLVRTLHYGFGIAARTRLWLQRVLGR